MPEIRSDHPFQISYEDSRLPRSLVVLRAESADALAEAYLQLLVALDGALGQPVEEEGAPPDPPGYGSNPPHLNTGKPPAQSSDKVPSLPAEALLALMEQGKKVPCECKAEWYDNRLTKKNPKYPDFKCTKCAKGVWLTAYTG